MQPSATTLELTTDATLTAPRCHRLGATLMRTPREFSEAGMVLRVLCRCGHEKRVDSLEIEFTHGEDFDLGRGWFALGNDMRCEACGDRPVIAFGDAEQLRLRA